MSFPNPKRLEFIQSVISRLSQNSFQLKAWTVAIVTAVLAFAAKDFDRRLALLAVYAVGTLCILDCYYLALERAYRNLYDQAAVESSDAWGITVGKPHASDVTRSLRSPSIWIFYLVSFFVSVMVVLSATSSASN